MDLNTFQILEYLLQQEQIQSEQAAEVQTNVSTEEERDEFVAQIVKELVGKVEHVTRIKEEYDAKLRAHNQYELFNMQTIIKNFYIDDALYERLTFRETLMISRIPTAEEVDDEGGSYEARPAGGICIDVQTCTGTQPFKRNDPNIDYQMMANISLPDDAINQSLREYPEDDADIQRQREHNKFLVHVSSDLDFNGKNGGSRITCWLDRNFHTLEELRREYLIQSPEPLELDEKVLLTLLKPDKYYIMHKDRLTGVEERKLYKLSKTKDYVSEGTNFVLMRYLAITKHVGEFELSCMYINGDMCRNLYVCTGPEGTVVNGENIDVCRVHRIIMEECGITHKCQTVLTMQGQIIRQKWKHCAFFMHINPLLRITNNKLPGNDEVLLQDCWVDDMQLMSKFLDKKSKCLIKIKSYLLDHPELKQMVRDYVQDILLNKPPNIIDYTITHFLRFEPEYMPLYDFFNY